MIAVPLVGIRRASHLAPLDDRGGTTMIVVNHCNHGRLRFIDRGGTNRMVPPRSSSGAAGCPAFLAQDASGLLQRESKGVVAAPAPRKTLLTLMTLQVARVTAPLNSCHWFKSCLRVRKVSLAPAAPPSPRPLLRSQRQSPSKVPSAFRSSISIR